MTARLYLNDVPSFPIPSFSQPALSSQVLEYTLPLFRLTPLSGRFPRFLCSTGAESPSLCFWLPSCPLCACRCCTSLRRSGPTHRAYRSAELPAPHGTGSRRPSRRRAQQKKSAPSRARKHPLLPASAEHTKGQSRGRAHTPTPQPEKKGSTPEQAHKAKAREGRTPEPARPAHAREPTTPGRVPAQQTDGTVTASIPALARAPSQPGTHTLPRQPTHCSGPAACDCPWPQKRRSPAAKPLRGLGCSTALPPCGRRPPEAKDRRAAAHSTAPLCRPTYALVLMRSSTTCCPPSSC